MSLPDHGSGRLISVAGCRRVEGGAAKRATCDDLVAGVEGTSFHAPTGTPWGARAPDVR